LRLGSMV